MVVADVKETTRNTKSIIITSYLQNDFIGFEDALDQQTNSTLYIGKNESRRLLGTDPSSGPVMQFMQWARQQPEESLEIFHIRGWNEKECDAVEQLGPIAIKNTEGAKLILDLDDGVQTRKNESYINCPCLNAFIGTDLEDKLCEKSATHTKVCVIGIWTDITIHYLLYELYTRYRAKMCSGSHTLELATCSSLTASTSRQQHFNALFQVNKVFNVHVFNSTSDLQEFLLPNWWKSGIHAEQGNNQLTASVPESCFSSCSQLFSSLSKEDKHNMSAVDKQIISYLYRDSSRVDFKRLGGGFSGSWVFRVASWDLLGHQQAPSILKVGERASITQERTNFERIEDVLGLHAPNIRAWCECKCRAGIKFAYASMALIDEDEASVETPSFRSLYLDSLNDPKVTTDHICTVLSKTFRMVLGKFYKVASLEPVNLFSAYDFNGKGWALRTGGSDDPDSVMRRARELLPENKDSSYGKLYFTNNYCVNNVSAFLRDVLPKVKTSYLAKKNSLVSFQHGDLNGRNILVDSNMNVWLIDFEFCERTHILKDILKIESDMIYEYTVLENEQHFEQGILIIQELSRVEDLSQSLPSALHGLVSKQMIHLWAVIVHIRKILAEIVKENSSPFQADIVLLRYSLFALALDHLKPMSRKLALAASCIWGDKIQHRYEKNMQYRVDLISENIGVAQLPGRIDKGGDMVRDLKTIQSMGINNIVCLSTPIELEKIIGDIRVETQKLGIDLHVHHIANSFIPTCEGTRKIISWIAEKLEKNEKCCCVSFSGLGRACTIAGAALVVLDNSLTAEQAIEKVIKARGVRAFETDQQRELVRKMGHDSDDICELAPW